MRLALKQFVEQKYRDIFNTPPVSESEDCLYLNIFTPAASTAGSGTPVLFWIHGGNFQLGSGQHPHVVGSSIAANENVIVVTMNYRLNGKLTIVVKTIKSITDYLNIRIWISLFARHPA